MLELAMVRAGLGRRALAGGTGGSVRSDNEGSPICVGAVLERPVVRARMAAEGWDYVRAETLPTEERSGLTGRSTLYHNVLVFRRPVAALETAAAPLAASQPQPEYPVSATPARAPEKAGSTPAVVRRVWWLREGAGPLALTAVAISISFSSGT